MTTEAERLTSVETKLDGFIEETRSRFNDMNDRFNDMNGRLNDMNTGMNSRFNDMNNRMSSIENRLNVQIGLIVTIGVTMVLTVILRT